MLALPQLQGSAQPTALTPEPLPLSATASCMRTEMAAVDGVVTGDMVVSADSSRRYVWVPPDSNVTEAPDGVVSFTIFTPVPETLRFKLVGKSESCWHCPDSIFDVIVDGVYQSQMPSVRRRAAAFFVGSGSTDWITTSTWHSDDFGVTVSTPGEHTLQVPRGPAALAPVCADL